MMPTKTMKEYSAEVTDMGLDHTLNIYQRMLKAQSMIETVQKNLEIEASRQRTYKAVCERDVLDAVKKAEESCGIYSFPFEREIYEQKETKNSYGTINFWMRFKVVYRFMNVDDPKDFIDITSYGDGVDTLDKAPGKGMTYADKYALMKAYKISTGDDPDKDPSEEQKHDNKQDHQEPNQNKPKKTTEELSVEWQSCRNQLVDLGVDPRSESIIQWMTDKTGYPDQSLDLTDPIKMDKVINWYKALIDAKKKKAT